MRIISLILIICILSSCAIHKKFPFICFASGCIKQQFDLRPLKKKVQMAMGGKKRKFKASLSSSKNNKKNNNSYSKNYNPKKVILTDSLVIDSTIIEDYQSRGSLVLLDTIVRIYYHDLTDSVLNTYKVFIKSFIKRIGTIHISEISLTDYYSDEGDGSKSIKGDIANYITNTGFSKHRLFWRKSKRLKIDNSDKKPKNLLYLEVHFY